MCDYSLEMYSSRPARLHERYDTTVFPSGSIGLAAPNECKTAVCVQYGSRLVFAGLPASVQAAAGVGPEAEATFVRLDRATYRDGVRFRNGKEVSLQQLGFGVSVVLTEFADTELPAARQIELV
jgi:hypothetical protein